MTINLLLNKKMQNNLYISACNLSEILNGSLADALTIDFPISLTLPYALYALGFSNDNPNLYSAIISSALPTLIAAAAYASRDIFRGKLTNIHIEGDQAKPTYLGGAITGACKYAIQQNGNLLLRSAVGAGNIFAYEYTRDYIFKALAQNKTIAEKISLSAPIFAAIEGIDSAILGGGNLNSFLIGSTCGGALSPLILLNEYMAPVIKQHFAPHITTYISAFLTTMAIYNSFNETTFANINLNKEIIDGAITGLIAGTASYLSSLQNHPQLAR